MSATPATSSSSATPHSVRRVWDAYWALKRNRNGVATNVSNIVYTVDLVPSPGRPHSSRSCATRLPCLAVPGSAQFTTVDRMVTVRLEPMTQSEYEAWRVVSVEQYSLEFVKSGILTEPEARKRGESDFARLLSDGLATTGHELFSAYDGTDLVGSLWLFSTESDPEASSFVYELAVLPDNRRRGYGRAIMQVAIDQCRERGVAAMSLNVFGHNTGARALYDSLGFQVSSTFMKLPL